MQRDLQRSHLCIPCRPYESTSIENPTRVDTALYVIGKAPGRDEDAQGVSFVGPSGKILGDWLKALRFTGVVDIFLANTVRCRLLSDDDPLRKADIQACRKYMCDDLRQLRASYKKIYILALGGAAVQALDLGSLREATRFQGRPVTITEPITIYRRAKSRRHLKTPAFRITIPRFIRETIKKPVGSLLPMNGSTQQL